MTECFFSDGKGLHEYHRACQGRLQAHHVISKNRLKREFPRGAVRCGPYVPHRPKGKGESVSTATCISISDILADSRNRIWLCDRHHQFVTNHRIYIPRAAMESVEAFATEYGLTAVLDKYAPAEEAA